MYSVNKGNELGHIFVRLDRNDNLDAIQIDKISILDSFIKHFIRETLDAGGIAEIAFHDNELVDCVYIFDTVERIGTVFTNSRVLLNHYFKSASDCSLFCEFKLDIENEPFSVLELDLFLSDLIHTFSNEVSLLGLADINEVKNAMDTIFRGMNLRWVESALRNGDRCFAAMSGEEIMGLGWCSIEEKVGHLVSLGVKPKYRKAGIGTDLLYARLLWMKDLGVHKVLSEISDSNQSSKNIALKAGFVERGKIFLYRIKQL
ncbi:MAG: GNAT family N-acetyltransferase [Thermoplasmata archaeon]